MFIENFQNVVNYSFVWKTVLLLLRLFEFVGKIIKGS